MTTEATPFDPHQLELETSNLATVSLKRMERVSELQAKGLEVFSRPVYSVLRASIEPTAEAFRKWRTSIETRQAGLTGDAYPFLQDIDPDVFSLISLCTVLNYATTVKRLTACALSVGAAVEREMQLVAFFDQQPELAKTISRKIDNSPLRDTPGYREKRMLAAAKKFEILWAKWTHETRVRVGMVGINCIVDGTGLVEIVQFSEGPRSQRSGHWIAATKELVTHLKEAHKKFSVFLPVVKPMVCEPLDHGEGERSGGYLLPPNRRKLVKTTWKQAESLYTPQSAPMVFRAVNGMQKVPLQVNRDVFQVLQETWDTHGMIPGAARRDDIPLPPEPPVGHPDHPAWKRESGEIFLENKRNVGKQVAAVSTLALAFEFSRYDRIWYPYQADFRGRFYAVPAWLQPQGTDMAKGLLCFARKKPVGERGYWWLCVHTANCAGVDKVSYEDRVRWVEDHRAEITRVAQDPIRETWWHDQDSPVQFLAACLELYQVWTKGLEHASGLAIMFDGSCNGLQHLAALSRDESVGRLVNLLPSDKPQSIYTTVAQRTTEILSHLPRELADLKEARDNGIRRKATPAEKERFFQECYEIAQRWHKWGFDRKGAKRCTMIVPYNGTISAFVRYLRLWVMDRRNAGEICPFGYRELDPALFVLAKAIARAIDETIPGPRKVMEWSKQAIRPYAQRDMAVPWGTPSGFQVVMAHPDRQRKLVRTKIGLKASKLVMYDNTDKLDKAKQARAFMPHYVHSRDAAHMHLTVCELLDSGVRDFLFNHDSFGTHLCHGDELQEITRDTFVRMYPRGVLRELHRHLQERLGNDVVIPEPPAEGTLDIEELRKSLYFFG